MDLLGKLPIPVYIAVQFHFPTTPPRLFTCILEPIKLFSTSIKDGEDVFLYVLFKFRIHMQNILI